MLSCPVLLKEYKTMEILLLLFQGPYHSLSKLPYLYCLTPPQDYAQGKRDRALSEAEKASSHHFRSRRNITKFPICQTNRLTQKTKKCEITGISGSRILNNNSRANTSLLTCRPDTAAEYSKKTKKQKNHKVLQVSRCLPVILTILSVCSTYLYLPKGLKRLQ